VENFDVDDERVGYFDGVTIFDFLTNAGVSWAYVEGNVGFLRMFDRYRLDTEHVIPYSDIFDLDLPDTFEIRVGEGKLPSVTFIDPRFIDVPPNSDANDDLPPADVCLGQQFVKKVYDLVSGAPTWGKTMLVVTYDEHGGFFDHVSPPGTPPNPASVARVHLDGADHLGVRVPAFVISPWVDAGKVINTQLEHTSIIKTILERFVSTHQANVGLSERSAQANSIFPELRQAARDDIPKTVDFPCAAVAGATGPAAIDDFKTSMRFIGLPSEMRTRITPKKST
jgi:phospholipase C